MKDIFPISLPLFHHFAFDIWASHVLYTQITELHCSQNSLENTEQAHLDTWHEHIEIYDMEVSTCFYPEAPQHSSRTISPFLQLLIEQPHYKFIQPFVLLFGSSYKCTVKSSTTFISLYINSLGLVLVFLVIWAQYRFPTVQ